MIGSVAGGQRTGVKRKAEEQAPHKRASGFSSSIQSSSSPPHSSSLTPASNTQLVGASTSGSGAEKKGRSSKNQTSHLDMEIESLLNQQSTKEQQSKKVGEMPPRQHRRPVCLKTLMWWKSSCVKLSREILELLNASTAKEQSIVEKFRSRGRAQVQEFCDHGTKEDCVRSGDTPQPCTKLHFRLVAPKFHFSATREKANVYFIMHSRIINKHTDESLGDCSFLNTCFHMDTCKYVHYEIDSPPEAESSLLGPQSGSAELGLRAGDGDSNVGKLFPSQVRWDGAESVFAGMVIDVFCVLQWICCDIRYLDVSILGKFAVVMADPPWDIHMELPYGTLTDDEMRKLNIPILQDDGFIFLWVTGR